MNKQVLSPAWSLIKRDAKKLLKGLLISIVGAVAAYLGQVSGLIDYNAYGQSGPFIALAVSVVCSNIANTLNKWISSTTYIK